MGAWSYLDNGNDDFLDQWDRWISNMISQDPVAWEHKQKWIEQNAKFVGDNISMDGNHIIGALMEIANVGAGECFLNRRKVMPRTMYCHPKLASQAKAQIIYQLENPELIEKEGWRDMEKRIVALKFELDLCEIMINTAEEYHYTVIEAPEVPCGIGSISFGRF